MVLADVLDSRKRPFAEESHEELRGMTLRTGAVWVPNRVELKLGRSGLVGELEQFIRHS
jgi:hypothetical protein